MQLDFFITLKDKLTAAGKEYATKNNINVQWDVKTAPLPSIYPGLFTEQIPDASLH
jgi:hypothetical protein